MFWKICIAIFISAALLAVPQNIIGCGGEINPYDYYTSFFNQYSASKLEYKPFYYTGEMFLYDREEPVDQSAILAKEWAQFTGNTASEKDAYEFVFAFTYKSIRNLYYRIEQNKTLAIPDSIAKNSMTKYFLDKKNLEALGYILFAKQVQPYVDTEYDEWSPAKKDSVKMNGLLNNGLQLYYAAKTDLFKLKYAYQVVRLAHYNNRYNDAIKYYDELVVPNPTPSVLQAMSLALKAGALFRLGRNKESAYLFSKAFAASNAKKVSNYYGFNWAVVKAEDRNSYLSLCKNNEERANMLCLFALNNAEPELETLKAIYKLHPQSPLLSTIAVREINKQEEAFLSILLNSEKPKNERTFYYKTYAYADDSILIAHKPGLLSLQHFLNEISQEATTDNGLYKIGAAYCAYMLRDFTKAAQYLAEAKSKNLNHRLQEQWVLTNLLVTISKTSTIDAGFEEQILPSLQWLQKKIVPNEWYGNNEEQQWSKFYRNLLLEVMAPRYQKQNDLIKQLMVVSTSDSADGYDNYKGIEFLRNMFDGIQAEQLYNYLKAKNFTKYEQFMWSQSRLSIAEVADFAGTAYLRDRNYDKAIEWLQKESQEAIEKNPFIDLDFDREERLPGDKVTTTKISFAKEMKRLTEAVKTTDKDLSKNYYKLALGNYNTTYYGYAWDLVAYSRSGTDGYYIPENATPFKKEYYGCFTAKDYFKKAMDVSTDKEFKAKCLFMMARCAQKQIPQPQYYDFNYNWDLYSAAQNVYYKKFKSNMYFPQFKKEYGDTRFYKEQLTRCSYLKDFVAQ